METQTKVTTKAVKKLINPTIVLDVLLKPSVGAVDETYRKEVADAKLPINAQAAIAMGIAGKIKQEDGTEIKTD